jgi:CRP-like cAMP-binding protein
MDEARLSAVPLFASLSKAERRRIAQLADELEIPPGRHLVDEGDWAYEFFVIETGTADVLQDDRKIAELGPGDFLGEVAALGRGRRTATVTATSYLCAIVMTALDIRTVAREMPAVGQRLKQAIEQRTGAVVGAPG